MAVHISQSVDVEIPYVRRNGNGELPTHAQMFSWEPEFMDMTPSTIHNVRASQKDFSIATSGFEYARLDAPPVINFSDPDQVKAKYFPKLEKMIKTRSVHLFLNFLIYILTSPGLGPPKSKLFTM